MFSKSLCALSLCVLAACAANQRQVSGRALTLLVVGPTRAQLSSTADAAGYARLRTLLTAEQRRAQQSLISVSVGDTFFGSGPAAWSLGEVVLQPFAALGIDVCATGPRDRMLGSERMAALLGQLPCALEPSSTAHASAPLRAATLQRAGVRVRFVVLDADVGAAPMLATRGVQLDAASLARVRAALQAERNSDHADVRVLVSDLAPDQARQLARKVPGFDVIVAAAGVAGVELEHDTLLITPGELTTSVGRLELMLPREGRGVLGHVFRSLSVGADTYVEDPRLHALVERALAPYRERTRRIVARSDMPLGRVTYSFIADALREAARADVALIPLSRTPALLQSTVTQAALWSSLPFDVPLTRQRVEGRVLQVALAHWRSTAVIDDLMLSGLRERANTGEIEVGARALRDADWYWVTAPGLTLTTAQPGQESSTVTMHEALDRYLEVHPFLRATPEGAVVAERLPASVQCKDQLRRR